jgi:hypothetical protein
MPYRAYENRGFAPNNRVPRFSGWIPENSAVGRLVNWPTNKMYPFFQKSQWAFPSFLQVWQELTSVFGAGILGLGYFQGN